MQHFKLSRHRAITIIYDAMFFFFIFKMFFYMTYVGRFPDEMEHISYIAYLEKTNAIIPDFKDMTVLVQAGSGTAKTPFLQKSGYAGTFKFGQSFNYLGHPPLYYQIMRLSGGVKVKNGIVTIDIVRLRTFNILLSAVAIFLMFYIGKTRLGNVPAIHLLYSAVCVSVPMLAYDCAGVNNDTLTLLGVSVFLLGLLRLSEKRYDATTYAIIGSGIAVTMLAKTVAGLAVVLSVAVFLVFNVFREKNLRFVFNRYALAALPACAVALAYFLAVHHQTGSFQPTFRELAPSQFYASTFYVPVAHRANYNFGQYAKYYWNAFMRTWTGIYSHVSLEKKGSFLNPGQIGLVAVWALPLPLLLQVRKKFHYPMAKAILSVYAGLLLTAAIQFFRAYGEFKNVSGYLGGYQSRYYLCMIPMLSLAAVYSFGFLYDSHIAFFRSGPEGEEIMLTRRQWLRRRAGVVIFCVAFTALLFYEDFIYFLLNFKDYM